MPRFELYFDKRGEIGIEDVKDLFDKFPQWADRAIKSALSSEGNRLKGIVRLAIQRGGLHGEWPKLNPNTIYMRKRRGNRWKSQWVKNWRGRRTNKQFWSAFIRTPVHNPMLRIAGAVRYKYHPDLQMVEISFFDSDNAGFSSPRLKKMMQKQAEGYRTPITAKMRKLAFAFGMPLAKGTTEMVVPPRPVIGPVFAAEKDDIYRNVKTKIYRSIARYVTGTEKRD